MKREVALVIVLLVHAGAAVAGAWLHSESVDKMDSTVTKIAAIQSDNSLSLEFPYSGENRGRLVVRQRKSDGLSVLFSIAKGQLICSHSDCELLVRFDEGKPIRFSASVPTDHSSNVLFIEHAKKFVELATSAKQVRVAATVYQSGTQIVEFSTSTPLKWDFPVSTDARTGSPLTPEQFLVQLSAFATSKEARAFANELKKRGYTTAYVDALETSRGTLWRVRVGMYPSREVADDARDKLRDAGYTGIVVPAK